MHVRIFVYGSMMDDEQIHGRCGSAISVGRALLKGHKLCFPRFSKRRRGAVAGTQPDKGSEVWGRLWDITSNDLETLDECEGFHSHRLKSDNCYNRITTTVFVNGDDKQPIEAEFYQVVPQQNPGVPDEFYMKVVIRGAKEANLPHTYIETLEAVTTAKVASIRA